ncbi:MAG: O-antigen ligase family protein [Dictyoglomaceae bacterium]
MYGLKKLKVNINNSTLKVFNYIFTVLVYCLILLSESLFKYPEIYFALFLTAGVYKADPRLNFLPKFLDLTVFFGFLTTLGVLYNILKGELKLILPPIKIFLSYIFIVLLGILSLSYTLAPIYGTEKILRFIIITSPAFFFPIMLFQKKEVYVRFFAVFVIIAIIMSFDIITGGLAPGEIGFHEALGSNYLAVGRISGIAILSALSLFFVIKQKLYKFCLLFIMGLFIFNMFISGGRGPLVSLAFSFVFIFIYLVIMNLFKIKENKFTINKRDFKLLSYIFLVFVFALFVVVYFKDYFSIIFYRLMLLENLEGTSIETRLKLYNTAINSLKDFPRNIVGLGIGGFSVFYNGYDAPRGLYPHNIFLEIGSELGILGLFAFIFVICKSIIVAFDNIKKSKLEWNYYINISLLMSLIFMLINSSVSGDINDNRLLFTTLGLIWARRRISNNES